MTEKNKMVVYTAIYGGYIKLKDAIASNGCDFVCFTDDPNLTSDTWEIRYVKGIYPHPRRCARMYKILPHKYFSEYECSLWVDGSHIPVDANNFITTKLSKSNITLFKHYRRNCIYQELKACIAQDKDSIPIMTEQIEKYKNDGYPANNGLVASTVIARKHNEPTIIKAMEDWWEEIKNHSFRDQLSFNYIMYKNKLSYGKIGGYVNKNKYFNVENHKLIRYKDINQ